MLNKIDLPRADLNLLVLFDVVLKHRHVGRAAKQLNLSGSAVSHGLGRLRRLLNDPLFLRGPKGVVPTARAIELSEPIAEILTRARNVIASAEPFTAENSTRRFIIGSPDGIAAGFLPGLLGSLRRVAPGMDIAMRNFSRVQRPVRFGHAWEPALTDLDAHAMDIAVLPVDAVPARFAVRRLYVDDFVIATRAGHPFARRPTLERFCEVPQLLVSLTGDAFGFVDEVLARSHLSRRIALTVPNFMTALAMIAESDLIGALPRQLVLRHGGRFDIRAVDPPLVLPSFQISSVSSQGRSNGCRGGLASRTVAGGRTCRRLSGSNPPPLYRHAITSDFADRAASPCPSRPYSLQCRTISCSASAGVRASGLVTPVESKATSPMSWRRGELTTNMATRSGPALL